MGEMIQQWWLGSIKPYPTFSWENALAIGGLNPSVGNRVDTSFVL